MFCDELRLNLFKTCLVDLLYFLFERFVAFAASLQLKSTSSNIPILTKQEDVQTI